MADELADLRRLTARHRRLTTQLAEVEQARDDEIRRLIAANARVADIATAAELKPPRIYQIRDRRR